MTYRIAGNVCGNLIVRFVVETENAQFYPAQYYFHAVCIGVIRRGSDCNVSTCTEAQRMENIMSNDASPLIMSNDTSPLITATAYGFFVECRLPCGFIDVVSSRTAVNCHCRHCHMVSDCVGVCYYVYTSAIIVVCGCAWHGTVPKCKI